jgi:hypothetical protein
MQLRQGLHHRGILVDHNDQAGERRLVGVVDAAKPVFGEETFAMAELRRETRKGAMSLGRIQIGEYADRVRKLEQ